MKKTTHCFEEAPVQVTREIVTVHGELKGKLPIVKQLAHFAAAEFKDGKL
jgi:hypothetical protein